MSEELDVILTQPLHERLQIICKAALAAGHKYIINGIELALADNPAERAPDGQRRYAYRLKCWQDANYEPLRQMIFAAIKADGEQALVTTDQLQQMVKGAVLRSSLVFYRPLEEQPPLSL